MGGGVTWRSSDGTIELFSGDCRDVLRELDEASIDACVSDPPYGLEFMGKGWDHGVPGVEYWTEVFRVLKPGAPLLTFGGTRTYHRLACSIEDAGFQIRDCMMWLYGSGFPKSHNIPIAIDKRAGAMGHRGKAHHAYAHGNDFQGRDLAKPEALDEHEPITDGAKRFAGYGTALKPAYEPVIVAMKPVDGSFAANAVEHGVAGLNIDACRITTDSDTRRNSAGGENGLTGTSTFRIRARRVEDKKKHSGRWPSNVVLDEEAAKLVDAQSGETTSGSRKAGGPEVVGNFGGASRFFYIAKASAAERDAFNRHPTVKPIALMRYLIKLVAPPGGGVILDPFMGSGSTGLAAYFEGSRFVGVELERPSFETAVARFRERAILADELSDDADIEPETDDRQGRLF